MAVLILLASWILATGFMATGKGFQDSLYHSKDSNCQHTEVVRARYLFYDLDVTEGFNFRRDVYIRFACFIYNLRQMSETKNVKLVLPPFSIAYHWGYEEALQIPWGHFFDLKSLKLFVPVIEMHEFFLEISTSYQPTKIDEVYVFQNFNGTSLVETKHLKQNVKVEECQGKVQTNYFYYMNISSDNIRCLYFNGKMQQLAKILNKSKARTILFDRAEKSSHTDYGGEIYWKARRSMRFTKELRKVAADFRKTFLNSSDKQDDTVLPNDWRDEKPSRNAKGGPYLAVHLRRKDFIHYWGHLFPSVDAAAKQIKKLLRKLNLAVVFIATDAPESELQELKNLISEDKFKVMMFKPSKNLENKHKPGGIAIIEQIICAHARFFIGTYDSNFSYRIQEEREILGFPTATTFNRFCLDGEDVTGDEYHCSQTFTNKELGRPHRRRAWPNFQEALKKYGYRVRKSRHKMELFTRKNKLLTSPKF